MSKTRVKEFREVQEVPEQISDSEVLYWLQAKDINWSYMTMLKDYAAVTDDVISRWLNISVRTLRNYKKPENRFKDNIKEQLLLLLSLFKHGNEVFGSSHSFNEWLNTENFYFDGVAPVTYLNTVTGVRFVDDRLSAMEYGDNI
jgi:putative toxin-antitoxin system antitoxin component (TIGR02293 family)